MIYPFIKNVNGTVRYVSGNFVLTGVKKLGPRALTHFCCRNTSGNFTVSFPDLEEVGSHACDSGLAVSKCVGVSFPKLKIIREYGFFRMFYNLYSQLGSTLTFPELTTVYDKAFNQAFSTTYITELNFPKLTTVTNNAFYGMMSGHSRSTIIHFPENMQSTIEALNQYPTFGGSSSYISCAFDL